MIVVCYTHKKKKTEAASCWGVNTLRCIRSSVWC